MSPWRWSVPLVLRNDAKHLSQVLKALSRVARLSECGLRGLVLGREISRHDSGGTTGLASLLHEYHKSASGDHHVETTLVGGDNGPRITHVLAAIDGSVAVKDFLPRGVRNG